MVKMVPYEAFACPCGAEDVVLENRINLKHVVNYTMHVHDQSLVKTLSDVIFYEKRNESVYWLVLLELQRLQFILQDLHRLQFILQDLHRLQFPLRELQEM
nr:hypothetical protein [Tanacetum cinerariifolium]